MKLSYKITFEPRALLFSLLFVLLPFSLFGEMKLGITFLAYTDEIICVICIIYFLFFGLWHGLRRYDFVMMLLLLAIVAIALIGNLKFKLISKPMPIIVDAICLLKIFLPFIVYISIGYHDKKRLIVNYLRPISKLLIILGAFFGTISQFVDIGMTDERRYGIASFYFVFMNEGRYGYIIAICLVIILITEADKISLLVYNLLAILNMIYTTKGVVYIVIVTYIVLVLMWRRNSKLSISNIIVLIIAGTVASSLQINTYLKDSTSPRVRLIKYGIKTANTYFPFGSGFATYGSDMALKNYSKLYKMYGFENFYGLSELNGTCLNDCYLGMLLGQFGYLGTALFIAMIILAFDRINKININSKVKAMCIAIFIGIVVSSVGTAIIKSSIGVMIFAFLGLVVGYSQQKVDNNGKTVIGEIK